MAALYGDHDAGAEGVEACCVGQGLLRGEKIWGLELGKRAIQWGVANRGEGWEKDAIAAVALVCSTMEVMMLGSSALPASASEDDLLEPTPTTTTLSCLPAARFEVDVDLNPSLPSTAKP